MLGGDDTNIRVDDLVDDPLDARVHSRRRGSMNRVRSAIGAKAVRVQGIGRRRR